MRNYEVVFIAHPDLDENALNDLVEKVKSWIADAGGTIAKVELWGKRQLAYIIRKQREGQYVFIKAQMNSSYCKELEHNFRFSEPILRFLITSSDV